MSRLALLCRLIARRGFATLIGVSLWALAVIAGTYYFVSYSVAAGEPGVPPLIWPSTTRLSLANDRSTLVVFAHPRCSCTRATLEELSTVLDTSRDRMRAYVVFQGFTQEAASWHQTDLWKRASALPGTVVKLDIDHWETQAFGAATSGHALLYSPRGNLLFNGGMTPERGQVGANAGRQSILALARSQMAEIRTMPVYGCPLKGKAGE